MTAAAAVLCQVLRRPALAYGSGPAGSSIDSILLSLCTQPAKKVDSHFSKEMTVRLFSQDPPRKPGLDLVSINIMRGRDHGVPGTADRVHAYMQCQTMLLYMVQTESECLRQVQIDVLTLTMPRCRFRLQRVAQVVRLASGTRL